MLPYRNRAIPVVAIANVTETFYEFPNRAEPELRDRLIRNFQEQGGDRTLLWLGDPKLVITSFPTPMMPYLQDHLGYRGTTIASPASPSPSLCRDIVNDPALMQRIVDHAGPNRAVQLVPYVTSVPFLQLAEALRAQHHLTVELPESPGPDTHWLRDYMDSKAGFRVMTSRWLRTEGLLPEGVVCRSLEEAAAVAHWFCVNGRACIAKPDNGMLSLGLSLFRPDSNGSLQSILEKLQYNVFLRDDLIVVEEFIDSPNSVSPSIEIYVPPAGSGKPQFTYMCNQVFVGLGTSLLVSRELKGTRWFQPVIDSALVIGEHLQQMGYAGHFDIDAIVDHNDHAYLVELNPRRTGGTHIHEFGYFAFGLNYLDQVSLLGHSSMKSGPITRYDELMDTLGDLLYPMNGEPRGVVISAAATLPQGLFGCILVGATTEDATDIQELMMDRLEPQPMTHTS